MNIDDFMDYLDGDMDFNETIDGMFRRLRRSPVIALSYYRSVAIEYRDWKPLPLKEYVELLKKQQWERAQDEIREAKDKEFRRILRSYRIRPSNKPKDDK